MLLRVLRTFKTVLMMIGLARLLGMLVIGLCLLMAVIILRPLTLLLASFGFIILGSRNISCVIIISADNGARKEVIAMARYRKKRYIRRYRKSRSYRVPRVKPGRGGWRM